MIPKKLHYVWFGGALPTEMARYVQGWKSLMPDHELIEWNERNVDTSGHPWLKRMVAEGKWAFASDYVRLLVLHQQGGIYLDTDMEMKKSLDPFRRHRCFFSFELDHYLSTAVIGCEAGHPLIAALLSDYDQLEEPTVNNTLVTRHFFRRYPEFRLGNREQLLSDGVQIYPKEYLVVPSYWQKKNFTRHHAGNSWRPVRERKGRGWIVRSVLGDVLTHKLVNIKEGWNTTFWEEERARRK